MILRWRASVAPVDSGHLHAAKRRPDVVLNGDAISDLGIRALATDVLRQEALDQVIDGRGPALGRNLGQGIAAGIDQPLERRASSRAPTTDQSGKPPRV